MIKNLNSKVYPFVEQSESYFRRTLSYSPLRFIIESFAVATIFKFAVALVIGIISVAAGHEMADEVSLPFDEEASAVYMFLLLCIFAPVWETIVFQWLPIKLMRRFTTNIPLIIGIDAVVFTSVHWFTYDFPMFVIILPVAVILAWSFFMNSKDSTFKAFWVTAAIHMLNNLVAFLAIL